MKPCYRHKDTLYLLAHIIKEGDQFPQPCKALISPGNGPTVTRATKEFLQRCGWLTAPPGQDSELASVDKASSSKDAAQLVFGKLIVGTCQLNTVLQVMDDTKFPEDCALSSWHIHIGKKDYVALQQHAWDADVCYVSINPEPGQLGSPPKCPLKCDGFLTALENGHPECLRHRHTSMCRQTWWNHMRAIDVAELPTAEALMYMHDVFGVTWGALACLIAVINGSIECLAYAHASGSPWQIETCNLAALSGKLQCLAYAHEHGCDWDAGVLLNAACTGNLECLRYAHTHGCPYDREGPVCPLLVSIEICASAYLTTQAILAPSMPCLVYVHEVMGCAWDPKGTECRVAFQKGDLQFLEYIHSHGGLLCTTYEQLMCPTKVFSCQGSKRWLNADGIGASWKARCVLYVFQSCNCRVKHIWHTKVGKLASEMIQARRVAVLLSFHAAGKVHVEEPLTAAAHAVMQSMPSDVLYEVICAAGLLILE